MSKTVGLNNPVAAIRAEDGMAVGRAGSIDDAIAGSPHWMRARNHRFDFCVFGISFCLAGALFARWGAITAASQWLLAILGVLTGLVVVGVSRSSAKPVDGTDTSSSYVLVLAAAVVVAVVLALFEPQVWMVPTILLALAAAVTYLASIERTSVGVSTALTITAFAVGFALTAIPHATIVAVCLGVMLLSGAFVLGVDDAHPSTRAEL